jgi:hypothetical protein
VGFYGELRAMACTFIVIYLIWHRLGPDQSSGAGGKYNQYDYISSMEVWTAQGELDLTVPICS